MHGCSMVRPLTDYYMWRRAEEPHRLARVVAQCEARQPVSGVPAYSSVGAIDGPRRWSPRRGNNREQDPVVVPERGKA
jgi:hypothetical protein